METKDIQIDSSAKEIAGEIYKNSGDKYLASFRLSDYGLDKNLEDPRIPEVLEILAKVNPRKRAIATLHDSAQEERHLMFNLLSKDSYARPHRHKSDEVIRRETFRIIKGKAALIFFNEDGSVNTKETVILDPHQRRVATVREGRWHTLVPFEDGVCVMEAKNHPKGGWDPETDKEFLKTAPEEGSREAPGYLEKLIKQCSDIDKQS